MFDISSSDRSIRVINLNITSLPVASSVLTRFLNVFVGISVAMLDPRWCSDGAVMVQ